MLTVQIMDLRYGMERMSISQLQSEIQTNHLFGGICTSKTAQQLDLRFKMKTIIRNCGTKKFHEVHQQQY
jgi:hypothetical protein